MTAPRTIRHIRTLYFSATGTTEKAVRTLSEALAEALDIPVTHFSFTSPDKRNIPQCCACVKFCPEKAKYFTDEKYLYHQHELELGFARRAEPAFFLSPISPGGSE